MGREEVFDVMGAAHTILETQRGVGNVWSVETLRRWARETGDGDAQAISNYIEKLPRHLTSRFVNENARAALVTGRLPNLTSKDAVLIMDGVSRLDYNRQSAHRRPPYTYYAELAGELINGQ